MTQTTRKMRRTATRATIGTASAEEGEGVADDGTWEETEWSKEMKEASHKQGLPVNT